MTFRKVRSRNTDMTEGKIFGRFIAYVLPFMFTNLLQVLYNAADIVVVGLSSEPDAVGAVGTTTAFVNLIVGLFMGCSVGAEVVLAHAIGKKDDEETEKAVHTSLLFGLLFGIFCGGLGFFMAKPVLALMGNDGKLLELATLYTHIYFLGLPLIALTNFSVAVLHAKGDSRTPFWVLTSAGILNVVLNLILVLGAGMSVEGVAIATVAANAVSAGVISISMVEGICFTIFALSMYGKRCSSAFSRLSAARMDFSRLKERSFSITAS